MAHYPESTFFIESAKEKQEHFSGINLEKRAEICIINSLQIVIA